MTHVSSHIIISNATQQEVDKLSKEKQDKIGKILEKADEKIDKVLRD